MKIEIFTVRRTSGSRANRRSTSRSFAPRKTSSDTTWGEYATRGRWKRSYGSVYRPNAFRGEIIYIRLDGRRKYYAGRNDFSRRSRDGESKSGRYERRGLPAFRVKRHFVSSTTSEKNAYRRSVYFPTVCLFESQTEFASCSDVLSFSVYLPTRHISTPYRRKFRAITFNWKRTMPSDSVCNRYRSVPQYTKSGVFNWAPPPRKNLRNSSLRLPVNAFNENVKLFEWRLNCGLRTYIICIQGQRGTVKTVQCDRIRARL